jgi:hypothetical protein
MLVSEFTPSGGDPSVLFLVAILLTLRAVSGRWDWNCLKNPVFLLAALGWVLGLKVVRFWADWGLPALALWIAIEMQKHFARVLAAESFRRLTITLGLCAALYFAVTDDGGSRWTRSLTIEYLKESDPEMDPWLPEDGGTLYSSEMGIFYKTFFANPNAKWKYILGFESTFMPPADLEIHRNIQWNFYAHTAYAPWVAKMLPQDRLVLSSSSSTAPAIPGLEWKLVARETWVGRLPREGSHAAEHSE